MNHASWLFTHMIDKYEQITRIQSYCDETKAALALAIENDEKARNAAKEAAEKLAVVKKEHRLVKNRIIFLIGESIQEKLHVEKPPCVICYEKYCDQKRQECALPCGHRFCYPCLDIMTPKTCPNCRKEFTMPELYKLFQQF